MNLKPGDRTCKKVFVTSVASIDGAALNQSGMFGFGAQLSASRVGSELVTMVFWEDREGSKVLQSGSTKKSDVYSGQVRHESSVAQQIILAAHNRGTRNILHVDRQQIITVYMQEFARHYSAILTEGGREVRSMVSKMIDDVFSSSEKPCTAALANELRRRVSLLEAEAHEKMDEAFRILEKHNVHPDLLFTTNEHYLNDLVQKMLAADKEMTSDAGSARHIYHNVRAFLKVQRKQVCETAAKELVRTGVLLVEEAFEELMTSDLSDCHHLLEDELESVTKQRTKLEARKRVLEQAATLLPPTKRCKRGFLSSLSRS